MTRRICKPFKTACREYEATLLVDVAHDLGAVGPDGTGILGLQGLLGKVDLVIGSFSKVFASNGGFVCHIVRRDPRVLAGRRAIANVFECDLAPSVRDGLEGTLRSSAAPKARCCGKTFAMSLTFCAKRSPTSGVVCLGKPGPLVPVLLGREAVGRITAALCFDRGVFANLIEYPAVSVGACRFRMQVMATHTCAQAQRAAEVIGWACQFAKQLLGRAAAAAPSASASAGA